MEPVYNAGGLVVVDRLDPARLKSVNPFRLTFAGPEKPYFAIAFVDVRYENRQKYFQNQGGDANEEADQDWCL